MSLWTHFEMFTKLTYSVLYLYNFPSWKYRRNTMCNRWTIRRGAELSMFRLTAVLKYFEARVISTKHEQRLHITPIWSRIALWNDARSCHVYCTTLDSCLEKKIHRPYSNQLSDRKRTLRQSIWHSELGRVLKSIIICKNYPDPNPSWKISSHKTKGITAFTVVRWKVPTTFKRREMLLTRMNFSEICSERIGIFMGAVYGPRPTHR